MQRDKIINDENIELFLEDANKPTIVMDLSGNVLKMNNEFRMRFAVREVRNVKDLFGGVNEPIWDEYLNMIQRKKKTLFARRTIMAPDLIQKINLRLMYFYDEQKIAVFFTMPEVASDKIEKQYLKAFKKTDMLMFLVDTDGIVRDVNDCSNKLFNVRKEDIIGRKGKDLIELWSNSQTKADDFVHELVSVGKAELTYQFTNKLNQIHHYRALAFFDSETNMYVTRIEDQTSIIKLKERLSHADALSYVGEMAASIAHEIRNPMTTLKGFVQLLKASVTGESQNYLAVIDDEINRMESILSEMLALSKPLSDERKIISVQEAISEVCKIIYPIAHLENIEIVQKDLTTSTSFIHADTGRIKQVLLNIFKNSMEAMSEGGTFTIEINTDVAGDTLLTITDTGKGMDPSQLSQIFTPFFTKKELGTGLGLPFVKETIEEYNGTIQVESEIGVGTKFIISFSPIDLYHSDETSLSSVGLYV